MTIHPWGGTPVATDGLAQHLLGLEVTRLELQVDEHEAIHDPRVVLALEGRLIQEAIRGMTDTARHINTDGDNLITQVVSAETALEDVIVTLIVDLIDGREATDGIALQAEERADHDLALTVGVNLNRYAPNL